MASEKTKTSQQKDRGQRGERIQNFLDRAAPVIAAARGINADSRVKLMALAADLGLTEKERDQALESLQSNSAPPPPPTADQRKRRNKFELHVGGILVHLPGGVLSASMEQMLIDDGCNQFDLNEEQSRESIHRLLADYEIRYISADEIHRRIRDQVAQQLGDKLSLDDAARQKLYNEGMRWGLTPDQVDDVIHKQTTRRIKSENKLRLQNQLLIGGSGVAVVLLFCFLLWMAMLGPGDSPSTVTTPEATGATVVPESTGRPPQRPATRDESWMDTSLSLSLARGRLTLDDFDVYLTGIRSSDVNLRGEAYENMISRYAGRIREVRKTVVLQELVAGCLALDPSTEAADRLQKALVELVPPRTEPLKLQPNPFIWADWSLRTSLYTMQRNGVRPERVDKLVTALAEQLQTPLDAEDPPSEVHRQALASLVGLRYSQLVEVAADRPLEAGQLHSVIWLPATRSLDAATLERLDTRFFVAILPRVGKDWLTYDRLIESGVKSSQPQNVLQFVKIVETTDDEKLKGRILTLLFERTGIVPDANMSVEEYVAAVREQLGSAGGAPYATAKDRLESLLKGTRKLLAAKDASSEDDTALLQQTVRLTHWAAMAHVLSQGEIGEGTFDTLNSAQPAELGSSVAGGEAPERRQSRSSLERNRLTQLNKSVRALSNYRRIRSSSVRTDHVKTLANFAEDLEDLEPREGRGIAAYMLGLGKTDNEQEEIVAAADKLARWKYLRLGLADEILSSSLPRKNTQELMRAVLGRNIELASGDRWRRDLQRELLQSVARDVSDGGGHNPRPVWSRAGRAMQDVWSRQAEVLGLPPDANDSPATVLKKLIQRVAEQLASRSDEATTALLKELPHELIVAEKLGSNDVRHTALLQRIWLKLIVRSIVGQQRESTTQAEAILGQLQAKDREAANALVQLRDGARAELELRMLLHNK